MDTTKPGWEIGLTALLGVAALSFRVASNQRPWVFGWRTPANGGRLVALTAGAPGRSPWLLSRAAVVSSAPDAAFATPLCAGALGSARPAPPGGGRVEPLLGVGVPAFAVGLAVIRERSLSALPGIAP